MNVNTTNPDSLDARLFPSEVLAVAPAVTMNEASSLSWYLDREDASCQPIVGYIILWDTAVGDTVRTRG